MDTYAGVNQFKDFKIRKDIEYKVVLVRWKNFDGFLLDTRTCGFVASPLSS
jgi:hypothetical protein